MLILSRQTLKVLNIKNYQAIFPIAHHFRAAFGKGI